MHESDIPKLGEFKVGEQPPVFELVLADHIQFVDPIRYGVECESINPAEYFVTSGDAVQKTIVLERDLWALASELRKRVNRTKASAKLKKYEKAIWSSAGKARSLLNKLIKARGDAIFLETEFDNHHLYCTPKNPRNKNDNNQ